MPYRLAITIAGAVSLGSFEAGVLFEVLDALREHNQTAAPDNRVYIDVLTGASAGGMTAAIAAQSILYSAAVITEPYDNVFYNAWVAGVDIDGLLPLGSTESADQSVLSSNFVKELAEKLILSRYAESPAPTPVSHPALTPTGALNLGLALSNLNGINFQRSLLSGGTFNYTRFEDQISFPLSADTDTRTTWTRVMNAAIACGAFPFAFRPVGLARAFNEYSSRFLTPWAKSPSDFTYTDGGVFQNQPLGLAKNIVDSIDCHQNSDTRWYLFVSPRPVDPTISGITGMTANFRLMAGALVNAIYNQAGFQDWIEAETVNDAISLLNQRASELLNRLKSGVLRASVLDSFVGPLLTQFGISADQLQAARTQLQTQFNQEYLELSSSIGSPTADAFIDTILLLELSADLHEKDEMYIYSINADRKDLAGAGLFSFLGFLYRNFRQHDYDLGRHQAQLFLTKLDETSGGKLPRLIYMPKPINPIQGTPQDGFTPTQIPEQKRRLLCGALSKAADNILKEEGISWVIRKGIEIFYVNGKIKKALNLRNEKVSTGVIVSEIGSTTSTRKPRGWSASRIIALASVLVALCALGLSVYEGYENRLHNRLSVQPYATFGFYYDNNGAHFDFNNWGPGPAVIYWFRASVDGKSRSTWRDVLNAIGINENTQFHQSIPAPGVMIPPTPIGQTVNILSVEDSVGKEALISHSGRIKLEACYCSLYRECWIASTETTTPVYTKACEPSPVGTFIWQR